MGCLYFSPCQPPIRIGSLSSQPIDLMCSSRMRIELQVAADEMIDSPITIAMCPGDLKNNPLMGTIKPQTSGPLQLYGDW